MSGHPGGHSGGHPGSHPGGGQEHGVFHRQYEQGAPWDIGRPQPAYVELQEAGVIKHRVLEPGCGTGALALYLGQQGHEVVGLDVVPAAIEAAREKVAAMPTVRFEVANLLEFAQPGFPDLGSRFDSVVDVGFFHALTDEQRPVLLHALEALLEEGGDYFFLCFSDKVPGAWGPRRISEAEIRETFSATGWEVVDIKESVLESARPEMPQVDAWLAHLRRV